jgi:hypothetical protein
LFPIESAPEKSYKEIYGMVFLSDLLTAELYHLEKRCYDDFERLCGMNTGILLTAYFKALISYVKNCIFMGYVLLPVEREYRF